MRERGDTLNYKRADAKHPRMGLNNKICKDPKYWCRLHQVWLSEDDVKRQKCLNKPTMDMIGTHRCKSLERRNING